MKKYDVLIIGAGPAGLYTSIILKKGTPMQVPNEPIKVGVLEATKIGGLTQYAFIQITKKWAFSGRTLIQSLYEEAVDSDVDFFTNYCVTKIKKEKNLFHVISGKGEFVCKYLIIATGILTFPNILDNDNEVTIGLHTPKEMVREIEETHHWKSVLIIGNNKKSIYKLANDISEIGNLAKIDYYLADKDTTINDNEVTIGLHTPKEMVREIEETHHWKSVLIIGNNKKSIYKLANDISEIGNLAKIDYYLADKDTTISDKGYGLSEKLREGYDGLLFDYNSYKLNNGSTYFLKDLGILQKNGFILTNAYGETSIPGLFAVGSVTMPISGVPEAIYSSQITGFYVGHLLEKTTIADPSGRFPFFPRENNWKESYQHELED